ncbi:hypothetical protein [Nostoc punctiforme]|uniref:Uncharacterized protein n=2 Tax=Nostoc punctiforme TaxID=272131 RepID=B2ITC8_NOSP7|nr:hypothetical protein [Nostoc punctiforme]ACC81159.1 hypothetical protein Npun_R2605 [Nostoc punctiforme PCC 73102]RCJ42089.1 hypothetical protein A6769_38145 [Nostoc punctiforme NIES-2108]
MSIAKFLNTARIKTKIDALIDNTSAFLVDPNKEIRLKTEGKQPDMKLLDQYIIPDEYAPMEMTDDFRVLEYMIERNMAIASIIATGQEIPQTRAGRLTKIEGSSFGKIAISHIFNEEDEIRMMELAQMQNMPRYFVDLLIGTVDSLQPRVVKTANVLWWQTVTTGLCDFTDTRSGSRFRLQYNTEPTLFPAPLTGNTLGSAIWTDATNANGIDNLQRHARAFYDLNGYYPDETVLSQDLMDNLLRQQSTRNYALGLGIINNVPGSSVQAMVGQTILEKITTELKIPKLRVSDAQYEIEIAPGQNIRGRYFPNDTYVFLTKGMSKRLFGPTIEAKGKPGIFIKSEETLKSSPPESRSYAVGRMIPWIAQPKQLAARKVA